MHFQVKQLLAAAPGWRACFVDPDNRGQFKVVKLACWAAIVEYTWGFPSEALVGCVALDGAMAVLVPDELANFYCYLEPDYAVPEWDEAADVIFEKTQRQAEDMDFDDDIDPIIREVKKQAPKQIQDVNVLSADDLNKLWGDDNANR